MKNAVYHCIFNDIDSKPKTVRVVSTNRDSEQLVRIAVNDDAFLYRRHSRMEPIFADLVDIAIAVYIADRLCLSRQNNQRRSIHVHVPLRHPEIFEQTEIYGLLRDTLHQFSHDDWEFGFSRRSEPGRLSELQTSMGDAYQFVEVALWSGGLDALAGLHNRIDMRSANGYTLFGTGSNFLMQNIQKQTAHQIQNAFPKHSIKFEQVPFRLIKMERVRQNSVPRLRGFLFLLLGAVCACLDGQQVLHIYENGVGAINLPYLKSSTGLDHSRAVHPISLCYMSEFVSAVLQNYFVFRNPFLFWTKAQMCALPVQTGKTEMIASTITCDRRLRSDYIHCSRCSSCLLRRQALLANACQDQLYRVPAARRSENRVILKDGNFLRAMFQQVDTLKRCVTANDPWGALASEYADLPPIVWWLASTKQGEQQEIEQQLVQLYRQYVAEWDIADVRQILSQGLLLDEEMEAFV